MHKPIPCSDPLLELLDRIEDAVQLLAFDYVAAAGDELRRAQKLLDGALGDWHDADAELARAWLRQAAAAGSEGQLRACRGHCAGALWRARRAVRRHWLSRLGVAWDPYDTALTAPGSRARLRLVGRDDGGPTGSSG